MKKYVFIFSAGTTVGFFAAHVIERLILHHVHTNDQNPFFKFTEFGLPSTQNVEYYRQYITSIDYARRIPSWTGYTLSRDMLLAKSFQPSSTRTRSEFKSECLKVPAQFRATNEDYFDSGWSRGHMAPAGDHKYGSQLALDETFILSANIVPQNLDNNGNYWYRIEQFARG
ncbi:unnamed protein product, partial [Rotaria sp. Silwood1]